MPQMILPIFSTDVTFINPELGYAKRDGMVYYFHGSFPVFCHAEKDLASFRMFTSQLIVGGQCKPKEIITAFGISPISIKRHVKRFREKGAGGFYEKQKARKATVLTKEVLNKAQGLLNEGFFYKEAAEELGIKPNTLDKAIRSGKLIVVEKKTKQPRIPKANGV